MWKAVRQHPWRLEIVPAVAFGLAAWSLYVWQTRVACVIQRIPELRRSHVLALPWLPLGSVLFLWLIEFGHNHWWVQSERHKRFNLFALILQALIVMKSCVVCLLTCMFLSMMRKHPYPPMLTVLLGSVALGVGLTALLEWTRKCVPRDQPPEPPLPTDAVNARPYREVQIDWSMLAGAILLCSCFLFGVGTAVASSMRAEPVFAHSVLQLATVLLAAAGVTGLAVTVITVTPDALVLWRGLIPIRLALAEIQFSVPGIREENPKPPHGTTTWCKLGSRCIDITMKNGRIYRLGALRPSYICRLIGRPPAEHEA